MRWQPGRTLAEIEKEVILVALQFYGGNRARTADSLDISVRTLQNKLHQYGYMDGKLQGQTKGPKKSEQDGLRPEAWDGMEPGDQRGDEKHTLPVQEREEVQALPHEPSTSGDSGK